MLSPSLFHPYHEDRTDSAPGHPLQHSETIIMIILYSNNSTINNKTQLQSYIRQLKIQLTGGAMKFFFCGGGAKSDSVRVKIRHFSIHSGPPIQFFWGGFHALTVTLHILINSYLSRAHLCQYLVDCYESLCSYRYCNVAGSHFRVHFLV